MMFYIARLGWVAAATAVKNYYSLLGSENFMAETCFLILYGASISLICYFTLIDSLFIYVYSDGSLWPLCSSGDSSGKKYMSMMDFRGASWVGDIYQKFEAMCMEVEETICEVSIFFWSFLCLALMVAWY